MELIESQGIWYTIAIVLRFVTLVLTSVTKRPRVVQRSLRRLTRGLTRRSAGGVTFGAYEPPTPESPFRCEDVAKVECGGSVARLAIKGLELRREARWACEDSGWGGADGTK